MAMQKAAPAPAPEEPIGHVKHKERNRTPSPKMESRGFLPSKVHECLKGVIEECTRV